MTTADQPGQSPLRIVVIGGVAAGASAATKARRTNEDAEITIFERGPYVSFANCGLPYYVGGEIQNLGDLLLVTPELFAQRFGVQVALHHEATSIDRAGRRVRVLDLQSGEPRWVEYDRLILATGGRPIMPPIPDISRPGIFSLTTVPDASGLRDWLGVHQVRQAVVVGAGFIGLEAVEALINQGLEAHLVEKLPQVLPQIDPEIAQPLAAHLATKGARLHLGAEVVRFVGSLDGTDDASPVTGVALGDGTIIPAQAVVVAIGVRPDASLAREAGLELGPTGGVKVDATMKTSDPLIYAAGDIAEVTSRVTGMPTRIPLAGPANKEGRVAGSSAAGGSLTFGGVVGTSIVRVCDLAAGKTGLSEREARLAGFDPLVAYVHPANHATYYPGSNQLTIKIVADRSTGRLLGGQVIGGEGVDKRTDVLATAIYAGLTVEDLEGLDLAYAPPFGSAKDAINMAGFVAANEFRGEVEVTTATALGRALEAGPVRVLDVRTPAEFDAGHIPGARLQPLDTLRSNLAAIEHAGPITICCGVGYRSYHACKILEHAGHQTINLSGGFTSWAQAWPDRIEK